MLTYRGWVSRVNLSVRNRESAIAHLGLGSQNTYQRPKKGQEWVGSKDSTLGGPEAAQKASVLYRKLASALQAGLLFGRKGGSSRIEGLDESWRNLLDSKTKKGRWSMSSPPRTPPPTDCQLVLSATGLLHQRNSLALPGEHSQSK